MLLILPKNETPRNFNFNISDVLDNLNWGLAYTMLPEFDKTYHIGFEEILENMGLVTALDSGTADFGDLVDLESLSRRIDNIYIQEVFQDVRIIVDRYGTEAAAATVVTAVRDSISPTPTSLIFNRPFIYAIIDTYTGIPLFIGVLDHPTETN